MSEHRGYVWSWAVPHTHTSSNAVHLATPSAVDALTNPLLPSPVWAWLVSTHQVKAAWAYTNTGWHAVRVVRVSEEDFMRVVKTLTERFYARYARCPHASLSLRRANMRGVRRKMSLGWQRWAADLGIPESWKRPGAPWPCSTRRMWRIITRLETSSGGRWWVSPGFGREVKFISSS